MYAYPSLQTYRKPRRFSEAYFRFKRQLDALNAGDLKTVRNLASEAKEELETKKIRSLRLPFTH